MVPFASREGFTVQILRSGSAVAVGIGFLVTDRHVLTCAHVINAALGRELRGQDKPPSHTRIQVEFPMLAGHDGAPVRSCRIEPWVPPPVSGVAGGDVAGLIVVDNDLPHDAGPARLAPMTNPHDITVALFGLPSAPARQSLGAWSQAILRGLVGGGAIQVDTTSESAVRLQPGYSGSPLVITDETGDAVIGMLTSVAGRTPDRDGYALPVSGLINEWPDVLAPLTIPPSPYKGLSAFTADDAEAQLFVGREGEVSELRQRINRHGWQVITGPSGVGKSSLIDAGVAYAMRRDGWDVVNVCPGQAPFYELARALLGVQSPDGGVTLANITAFVTQLRAEGLTTMASKLATLTRRPLLVCIDPLEDVLDRNNCPADTQREFLDQIFSLAGPRDMRIHLVGAVRADFLDQLLTHPGSGPHLRDRLFTLSPMDRDGLTRVITEPALVRNVEYEPGLVDLIAADAGHGGSLPLLEFALSELWPHQQRRQITLTGYRDIGGVSGALGKHADHVYEDLVLEFPEQEIRRVLLALVHAGPTATRRLISRSEFTAHQRAIADVLVDKRLVVSRNEKPLGDVLEITHEALLQKWERLNRWIADDWRFLDWHARMRDLVDAKLLPKTYLTEARDWLAARQADIDPDVQEMIACSQSDIERQVQLLTEARDSAEAAARKAEALRLASLSDQERLKGGGSASAELALAVESLQMMRTVQGDLALRQALTHSARPLATLQHEDAVNEAVFSPDGRSVATASSDGFLRVFSTNGEEEIAPRRHFGPVTSVAFSPHGGWLVTAPHNGTALVLDATSGEERCRLVHEDSVRTAQFSPNEDLIATACDDGSARMFDAASGRELFRLPHAGPVNAISFSPDGGLLATACGDKSARMFDTASGRELFRLPHAGPVNAISFSPDGDLLATACDSNGVYVFAVSTGKRRRRLNQADPVKAVGFSHNGSLIAVAGGQPRSGSMHVFDALTGRQVLSWTDQKLLDHTAFNGDDTLVAAAGQSGLVRVFDLRLGSERSRIKHDGAITSIALSQRGSLAITAGQDKVALVSQLTIGPERSRVGHAAPVNAAVIGPGDKFVATAGDDRVSVVFDAETGAELSRTRHDGPVNAVAVSPDGTLVATASNGGSALVSDFRSDTIRVRVEHDGPVQSVVFSRDGQLLATASGDRTARVIQIATGHELARISHAGPVNALALSPNSRWIATASSGPGDVVTAKVVSARSGQERSHLVTGGWVHCVTFSPNGKWVAAGRDEGTVGVYNAATGAVRSQFDHDMRVNCVAFSPDGRWLATASDDRTARVVDPASGAERTRLDHDSWVNTMTFSSDGMWLATASDDRTARVFDPGSGEERCRIQHDGAVTCAMFSSDGKWLVTASSDGTARVTPIDLDTMLALARERMVRPLTAEERKRYSLAEPAVPEPVSSKKRTGRNKKSPVPANKQAKDERTREPKKNLRPFRGGLYLNWYRRAAWTVVVVAGEIDVYTAPRLRELCIELVNNRNYNLIINLERVEFLDSTGLGVLVGALKRARGHNGAVSLICTQERILKIFRITGQTKVFGIYDSVHDVPPVPPPPSLRPPDAVMLKIDRFG